MMAGAFGAMRAVVASRLGTYAPGWDALVDSMALPSPFLRSWWLDTASEAEPCIVLVLHGDQLIGGVALERARHLGVDRLRMLGSGTSAPTTSTSSPRPTFDVTWCRRFAIGSRAPATSCLTSMASSATPAGSCPPRTCPS